MLANALLLIHLVSFAAYLGAGFAQLQFVKRSMTAEPAIRDDYERLAAAIVTKIELPAIMGSIASGIGFLVLNGGLLHQGWLHGKLTCVLALVVLSHLEMFNARAIVKLRASGQANAEDAIAARKKRHAAMGAVGSLLVVAILVLVTFVRLKGS